MNKRMIILIVLALLATAGAASAGTAVDEVEIRGTVVEADGAGNLKEAGSAGPSYSGYVWPPYTFGAFWYELDDDLSSEMLRINSTLGGGDQRVIPNDQLIYSTTPQVQMYKYCMDAGYPIGVVSGNNITNYFVEGWMAEKYVAISTGGSTSANANKLSKLLVEFETGSDKKILKEGVPWDIVGGFTLNVTQVGSDGDSVILSLEKNGAELDTSIVDISCTGDKRYMYTETISGVSGVVVFFCYIDAVCVGDPSSVQLKYVYLIDNDVEKISVGTTYGNMEVKTAGADRIVLHNDGNIDLSQNTDVEIMNDMYFRVADSDTVRFYPYKLHTEPGDYDVRGTVVEALPNCNIVEAGTGGVGTVKYVWSPYNYAAFWYDLDDDLSTEYLNITTLKTGDNRTIVEKNLTYSTRPVAQRYQFNKDNVDPGTGANGQLGMIDGAAVTSYYIEGWMAEKYVAISSGGSDNKNANKIVELLVEFKSSSDKQTLATEDEWDLGGGFTLTAKQIDLQGNKVWLSLGKNGKEIDSSVIDANTDSRYMYTETLSGVEDVVVFFCNVDAVFRGTESNLVQVKYVFLIDNDVEKIVTSTTYGNMEVKTASAAQIILKNDGDIDLSKNTDVEIMDDMYFKVADSDTVRFYPFVERTIDGTVPTPPETIPADDVDGDGVPDVWDADNSTPLDYWTDSDGRGRRWGDMNGDGKLTSVDALMILQAAAEKIDIG